MKQKGFGATTLFFHVASSPRHLLFFIRCARVHIVIFSTYTLRHDGAAAVADVFPARTINQLQCPAELSGERLLF